MFGGIGGSITSFSKPCVSEMAATKRSPGKSDTSHLALKNVHTADALLLLLLLLVLLLVLVVLLLVLLLEFVLRSS